MAKCIDCCEQTPDDGYQEICNTCYQKLTTQLDIAVEAFKEINHTYKPDSIHIIVDKALADMEAASNG